MKNIGQTLDELRQHVRKQSGKNNTVIRNAPNNTQDSISVTQENHRNNKTKP